MPGGDKYTARLAEHLGESIDAACLVAEPGTTGSAMGGAFLDGAIGGIVLGALSDRAASKKRSSDIKVGSAAWLGLGPDHFSITKASLMSGRPNGSPMGRFAYDEVTGGSITKGNVTVRVDLDLNDGRHLAFEAKRLGRTNRRNVAAVDSLRSRCLAD